MVKSVEIDLDAQITFDAVRSWKSHDQLSLTLWKVGSHMIIYVNYAEISLNQASANQIGLKRKLDQNYVFLHDKLLTEKPDITFHFIQSNSQSCDNVFKITWYVF